MFFFCKFLDELGYEAPRACPRRPQAAVLLRTLSGQRSAEHPTGSAADGNSHIKKAGIYNIVEVKSESYVG